MKTKRSEIFEEFAKNAIESGLIKVDAMTREEKTHDKEWMDTIKMLYGVNPNDENYDILDAAHPQSVVIAPSYDKVNGLVENLKERHNIMVGITQKPSNGNLTHHRYAVLNQDLLDHLLVLGCTLDNDNVDDLRKLADSCSEKIVKKAFAPLIWGAGLGVAALLGYTTFVNNTNPSDQGVLTNLERAINWVNDAKEETPQISGDLDKLIGDLQTMLYLATSYNALDRMDVSTPEKFIESMNTEGGQIKTVKKYISACRIMSSKIIPRYLDLLRNVTPQTKSWGDWLDKLVDVYRVVDPTSTKEAIGALETLEKSLIQATSEANYYLQKAKQQEPSLMDALSKMDAKKNSGSVDIALPETPVKTTEPLQSATETQTAEEVVRDVWNM